MRKSVLLAAAMLLSSPWVAFAGLVVDKQIEDDIAKHQSAMQMYAQKTGKATPEIVDFKYGMTVDVAKFIRETPDRKTCGVVSKLMSYEDSSGKLKTLRYRRMGDCQNQK